MNQIDVRFSASDMDAIKKMIGKRMTGYKCDPFFFSTSVYGVVGVAFDDASYAFTNYVQIMDYYGEQEDVAVFKIIPMPYEDIKSMIQNQEMIETPVNTIVSEISVVNERQQLFEHGQQTYDVYVTRGIIFKFEDGHEFSLEKNIWFSEDITVEKGYDLIERFTSTKEFEESWSGDFIGKCSREVISVSNKI